MVTICTGGTSDIPVAEEAAVTAELCGANVNRIYDIGVSGIHRLIDALPDIRKSNAVVAVAGMEGALASVLAGQTCHCRTYQHRLRCKSARYFRFADHD